MDEVRFWKGTISKRCFQPITGTVLSTKIFQLKTGFISLHQLYNFRRRLHIMYP